MSGFFAGASSSSSSVKSTMPSRLGELGELGELGSEARRTPPPPPPPPKDLPSLPPSGRQSSTPTLTALSPSTKLTMRRGPVCSLCPGGLWPTMMAGLWVGESGARAMTGAPRRQGLPGNIAGGTGSGTQIGTPFGTRPTRADQCNAQLTFTGTGTVT